MKSIVLSCWLACLGFCALRAGDAAPATSPRLCVMTFNLRYASERPPNAWPERRPVMAETIRKLAPDLIGTQEGLYAQLKDLAADLPEFEWIGLGREGGKWGIEEYLDLKYVSIALA